MIDCLSSHGYVIPAKAGIQRAIAAYDATSAWIPASAGMTGAVVAGEEQA